MSPTPPKYLSFLPLSNGSSLPYGSCPTTSPAPSLPLTKPASAPGEGLCPFAPDTSQYRGRTRTPFLPLLAQGAASSSATLEEKDAPGPLLQCSPGL